jgi:hypothetical protein
MSLRAHFFEFGQLRHFYNEVPRLHGARMG